MTSLVVGAVLGALVLGMVALRWARSSFVGVRVDGPSMAPTLLDGNVVLVRRVGLDRVRRGQIVVLELPGVVGRADPASARTLQREWSIKRAVAVPGDPVPETVRTAIDLPFGATVPPDALIVLGDNGDASYDSRQCGYIPADHLLGVHVRRIR